VFDYGHIFDGDDHRPTPYLAMEYLAGEPLSRVQRAAAEQPPSAFDAAHAAIVASVVADACEGLHAAHELRDDDGERLDVVHRDVSLANIMLTREGYAKVVDFGTVKSRDQRHVSTAGSMKGKISYMQPEVVGGATPDRRADIWGLGVIAWELITGRRLFKRPTAAETLDAVLYGPIPRPSELHPALPDPYDEVILRALERHPRNRYATAQELAHDLRDVAARTHGQVHRADMARWLQALTYGECVAASPAPSSEPTSLVRWHRPMMAMVLLPH
jgi:serine/threonine-protein kinase